MNKLPVDHFIGCILGGAIGDAMGAPIEFMSYSGIIKKYGASGVTSYVEYHDNIGRITDDTQMTIFTAEAMLRTIHRATTRGIWGAYLQISYHSYLRWLFTQYPDSESKDRFDKDGWILKNDMLFERRAPGNTCIGALKSGVCGTIKEPINDSKGCGGVMRVAPVGLMFCDDARQAFQYGAELAAITHGHPSGYLSAGAFASIISFICQGYTLLNAITDTIPILQQWDNHTEALSAIQQALHLFETEPANYATVEKLGGGWVAEEALAISLYCSLCYQDNFEKAIHLAINHSGDSDSTGAITGNIVGLINGVQAIPQRWRSNLEQSEFLTELAQDIHVQFPGDSFTFDEMWSAKYPPG